MVRASLRWMSRLTWRRTRKKTRASRTTGPSSREGTLPSTRQDSHMTTHKPQVPTAMWTPVAAAVAGSSWRAARVPPHGHSEAARASVCWPPHPPAAPQCDSSASLRRRRRTCPKERLVAERAWLPSGVPRTAALMRMWSLRARRSASFVRRPTAAAPLSWARCCRRRARQTTRAARRRRAVRRRKRRRPTSPSCHAATWTCADRGGVWCGEWRSCCGCGF
mmetsp:Transcript_30251/g.75129  ORF Transcript_30251/g.75129 Transcript_30251/m.75129 type:complete len:221 (+) Transcript_30251:177-839(+)